MTDPIVVNQDRHTTLLVTTRNKYTKEELLITGASLTFEIKTSKDKNATALVQKQNSTAGGDATEIEDSNLTGGEYKVHLLPDDTSGLGNYWCETKMTLAAKDTTILLAKFQVVPVVID